MKFTKAIGFVRDFFKFCKGKHLGVYAGGLAFFLFGGIVPFFGILYLVAEKLNLSPTLVDGLFSIFKVPQEQIANFNAAAYERVGTFFLILFAVYSATHFYFHLIYVGENIYDCLSFSSLPRRLFSLLYLLCVQTVMFSALFCKVFADKFINFFSLDKSFANAVGFFITIFVYVCVSIMLHLFAAPRGKKNFVFVKKGVVFTFLFWEVVGLFFSIYLNFKNANSNVITFSFISVFLLYLYAMILGLIYGIAFNAYLRKE